jgi:hypothetical protein
MRSLLLSVALGVGALGLLGATPARSEASWLSEALHARYDPYYYDYYSPSFVYPDYNYYTPGYVYPNSDNYAYPQYGNYSWPYYSPSRSFYWGGYRGHWHGDHHGWYGDHHHHR